jgi:hypothetical protein
MSRYALYVCDACNALTGVSLQDPQMPPKLTAPQFPGQRQALRNCLIMRSEPKGLPYRCDGTLIHVGWLD